MKLVVALLIGLAVGPLAQAKTREVASISAKKCESVATAEAKRVLQLEDTGSGLNAKVPVKFLKLNNGGVYVVSGWVQKVFDWEVIVIVDGKCAVQASTVN